MGRNVPVNLSSEKEEVDEQGNRPKRYYKASELAEMLKKRLNVTFKAKDDFISRFIISVFQKFLFLPKGFRNLVEYISTAVFDTLLIFIIYILGLFSVSTGLIPVNDKTILMQWYGLFLLFYVMIIWYKNRPTNFNINNFESIEFKKTRFIFMVIGAILIPVFLEIIMIYGLRLPVLNINVMLALISVILLGLVSVFCSFYLSHLRSNDIVPNTAVSEYKDELQLNTHPRDLFRFFDLGMADKRYKELPNRIYREMSPTLKYEGNKNKGNFHGDTIQETQPIYLERDEPAWLKKIRLSIAILGRILGVSACLVIFFKIDSLSTDTSFRNYFNIFFYSSLLFIFAYYLIRTAHIFWAEMLFKSHLIQFFSNGTFSESKVATGMSVYDSNRSENDITASKSTSWIFVSKIITSTIADSSTKNLEGTRYVLEMHKDESFLNDVLNGLNKHLDNNRLIAQISPETDIETIKNMEKLNSSINFRMNDGIQEHTQRNNKLDNPDS